MQSTAEALKAAGVRELVQVDMGRTMSQNGVGLA